MELGLRGKNALILASSKGIGKAIATLLAEEGANVMITSRSEKRLKEAVEEINKVSDSKVSYVVSDITDANSVLNLVEQTVYQFGSIDILINNAGGPPSGTFDDFEDEQWIKAFELTLLSYVRTIRGVLPYMRKQGRGRIVNVASTSFKEPIEGLILSNTYRTGVMGLAKSLSTELGNDNILINTLGPGRIQTDRINELEKARSEKIGISKEQLREEAEKSIPLGRYGLPEEFAKMAVFLCSEANSYITGQSFLIDGGKTKAF